jgi:hypothetical protein
MRVAVITRTSGRRHDIGLGPGLIVERDSILHAYDPASSQRRPQRISGQAHSRRVAAARGLSHDHLATQQLDGLVLMRNADVDQPVVFDARPSGYAQRIRRHAAMLPRAANALDVHERGHPLHVRGRGHERLELRSSSRANCST